MRIGVLGAGAVGGTLAATFVTSVMTEVSSDCDSSKPTACQSVVE